MITKIYFPIVNTDNLTYETDINLTVDDYNDMINDNFHRNRQMMNDFYKHGFEIKNNNYYGVDYSNKSNDSPNDCIEYGEAEASINDYNKNEINTQFFNNLITNEKMSMLEININPNNVDYDVESEIKMWVSESNNINNNINIDNKTKLSTLQGRDIGVDVEGIGRIVLLNCKVLKDNSTKNSPMNIVVIVEKIILK